LAELVAWATDGVAADLSVLVDVPVEVAADRLAAAHEGGSDRLERLGTEFAARVREGFVSLAHADPSRWLVVDGCGEVDFVTEQIVTAIRERFGDPPEVSG
jgi:dTMP kinase